MSKLDLVSAEGGLRYCFLDLETTGFDHENDSIIEVSFLVCDKDGKALDRLDEVIIPWKTPLTPTITRITGIEQSEIDTNGKAWEEVLPFVREKLQNTIIIGHNIDFDIRYLRENGVDIDPTLRIDTHELSRLLLYKEESYALEVLSQKYGFVHTDAHRAMSDVIASKDLFHLLEERIARLSPKKKAIVQRVTKTHDWYASKLFLGESLSGKDQTPENVENITEGQLLDSEIEKDVQAVVSDFISGSVYHAYTRVTRIDTQVSFVEGVLNSFADQSQKSVLMSPKLDFYPTLPGVPVPDIVIDPERLVLFEGKESLNDGEIAFLLKCFFRLEDGYTDVFNFDLFFVERDWWKEICIESESHPLFEKRLTALIDEPFVRISPDAFVRFIDHPCLKDRILVVDETEVVADRIMQSAQSKKSILSYIKKEETSVAAQFFVRNVCRDLVEPLINKQIGPFPEKVILPNNRKFESLVASAKEWADEDLLAQLEAVLCHSEPGLVRWLVYYPESGNMEFCRWHKDDWRETKKKLSAFKTLFLHRHILHERNMFGYIFFGTNDFTTIDCPSLIDVPKLVIPQNLVSAKDMGHIPDTAEKIVRIAQERTTKDHWVGAYFTSQETLRKTFDLTLESLKGGPIPLFGEKMAGGDGKLLEKLDHTDTAALCFQKIMNPKLSAYPFKTLLIQKFPFPINNPIGDTLSKWVEGQDISWWDVWVVPQLQANLSRRIGQFPCLEEVHFLDTRENSRWGKFILKSMFGEY